MLFTNVHSVCFVQLIYNLYARNLILILDELSFFLSRCCEIVVARNRETCCIVMFYIIYVFKKIEA